jgi:hypothetical protein
MGSCSRKMRYIEEEKRNHPLQHISTFAQWAEDRE